MTRRHASASWHDDGPLVFGRIVKDAGTDQRARLAVCDMTGDADLARPVLEALGLIDRTEGEA